MIPIHITYVIAFLFYLASVLIHVFVIQRKLDYKLVNGGRSKNFEDQKKQSQISIMILIVLFLYILSTALLPSFRSTIVYFVITAILVLFWLLGTILQLLGTRFEKRVVLWVNLVGLLSHLLLLFDYLQ